MRIVQLTPGTGNFYCGTCMRDNALVTGLRELGHDASILPLYLPFMTDEPSAVGDTPIFFGGINVYLQQKSALFRKTPTWLNRLFDSPWLLRWAAARAGMTKETDLGDVTLSMLRGDEGKQAKELSRLLTWLTSRQRPNVVCLSNALLAGLARRIKAELRVPVVCSLQGEDAFLDGLPRPYRRQAWETLAERSADIDAFIAVSHYYRDVMQKRLELPPDRVHVVHNGINLDGYVPASAPPTSPVIGYLARLCPQKGLDTLIEAFIRLKNKEGVAGVKLRVAGTMTADDEPFVAGLRKRLATCGLMQDVSFLTNIDHERKQAFLTSLSMLSVPATYGEAFGLYVLEALASGVPVVQPRHGAFPELIEATGGGILCEPNDSSALAEAIENLLLDPDRAQNLGRCGRRAVTERFSVGRMARDVARILESVTAASS